MSTDQLMTSVQVANLLQGTPGQVADLNERGDMPNPIKVGPLMRWRRSDIEEWIDDGCPTRARMISRCMEKATAVAFVQLK